MANRLKVTRREKRAMRRRLMASEQSPTAIASPRRVGMVSLGCPKALVDSERILTRLRADGYDMSADY